MFDLHAALLVAVMAGVTAFIRFLPFLVFGEDRKTPEFVLYLGKVLPYAIMGMLVVFCLKGIELFSGSHGIPEAIACAVTALLYVWRRNTLLSIIAGTACYMLLIQVVFA